MPKNNILFFGKQYPCNTTTIELASYGVVGSIPRSIAGFTSLSYLDLSVNSLNGSLPIELFSLMKLKFINICSNLLTGTIPTKLGMLTALTYFRIGGNEFIGTIPTELGKLSKLAYLRWSSTQVMGSIPSEVGRMTSLTLFQLYNNLLVGTLPRELGKLKVLNSLRLSGNQLKGSLPSQFGLLTAMTDMKLNANKLEDSIPSKLGFLTAMITMYINSNQLKGSIPSELGLLTAMTDMKLYSNKLEGSLPSELGFLTAMVTMDINSNRFTGSIPSELGLLTAMTAMELYSNHLEGSLPSEMGLLTALTGLDVSFNQLAGSIPSQLSALTAAVYMDLSSNKIVGKVPDGICYLREGVLSKLDADCASKVTCASTCCTYCYAGKNLVYYGGPVISSVQVYVIHWGGRTNVRYAQQIEEFYQGIVGTKWFNSMNQYKVGSGKYSGSYSFDDAQKGGLTQNQIQGGLTDLINAGHIVPSPNANTYFAIHFAPGYGPGDLCPFNKNFDACAWHSSLQFYSNTGIKVYAYGVIPDISGICSICSFSQAYDIFKGTCAAASHELAEAVTDPIARVSPTYRYTGWFDPEHNSQGGENADICNPLAADILGTNSKVYTVSAIWSDKDNSCVVPGNITGY